MSEIGSKVGPFTLGAVVGRGGMATVYEAQHAVDQHPVAVKILRPDIAHDNAFNAAFADEVRSAASLDHARITAVYDHGIIETKDSATRTPWLAMELVSGGTIARLAGRAKWETIKQVLLDVLDALAHAHARGLIHRDIKPANVLLDTAEGRIKLTDFGLAHSIDMMQTHASLGGPLDRPEQITGTPSYMAPEQIRNQVRELGPWTDLYAVGALAWKLTTGDPPYVGSVSEVLAQHLAGELPTFIPATGVPEDLLDWIAAMMAPRPTHRFRRAADAAWALSRIGPPVFRAELLPPDPPSLNRLDEPEHSAPPIPKSHAATLDTLVLNTQDTSYFSRRVPTGQVPMGLSRTEPSEASTKLPHPMVSIAPPFPSSWDKGRRRRLQINGAGLAMFGIRATGVVGREEERDRLWAAMKAVIRHQQTQMVILEGASGSGKSTVAQWFCQRVDEVGGAAWAATSHSAEGGPSEGIEHIVRQQLGISFLEKTEALNHARTVLARLGIDSAEDAIGLVELSDTGQNHGADILRASSISGRDEKHALVTRFLHAWASVRPHILWLDEAHHSQDTLSFARHLLETEAPAPLLILCTVSSEDVISGSETDALLDQLEAHDLCERIRLKPLNWTEQVNLMSELLGLEPGLASEVATKCGGNPQFAVQLVGDWVERGLLLPGDDGFELKSDSDASIPSNLLAIWEARLSELLEVHSDEALFAIELGAVLGNEVDRGEWLDALDATGLEPPEALMSDLLRLRLIAREDALSNWSFVHALFRETLLNHARSAGRVERWSSVCSDVLAGKPAHLNRWARLLVGAGRSEEALHPLQKAIIAEARAGEIGHARVLNTLRCGILESVEVDPQGPTALGSAICTYFLDRQGRADLELRHTTARHLADWARQLEDWTCSVIMLRELGSAAISQGNLDEGKTHLLEAKEVAIKHRVPELPQVMLALCFNFQRIGDMTEAFRNARESVFAAEAAGNMKVVASGYDNMAKIKVQVGELDRAAFYLEEARIRNQYIGARLPLASVWNTMGEIARSRGDFAGAERAYTTAADLFDSCGSTTALFAKINLCTTFVDAGKLLEAEARLNEIAPTIEKLRRRGLLCLSRLLLLVCRISARDWTEAKAFLHLVQADLEETSIVDIDIATTARTAARAAEEVGERDIAIACWTIAQTQFDVLKRASDSEEATHHLNALQG